MNDTSTHDTAGTRSLIAAITTLIHLQLGGQDVVAPMLQGSFDETAKITMYAVWHMVSVVLGSSAVTLLIAGLEGGHGRLPLLRLLAK